MVWDYIWDYARVVPSWRSPILPGRGRLTGQSLLSLTFRVIHQLQWAAPSSPWGILPLCLLRYQHIAVKQLVQVVFGLQYLVCG